MSAHVFIVNSYVPRCWWLVWYNIVMTVSLIVMYVSSYYSHTPHRHYCVIILLVINWIGHDIPLTSLDRTISPTPNIELPIAPEDSLIINTQ